MVKLILIHPIPKALFQGLKDALEWANGCQRKKKVVGEGEPEEVGLEGDFKQNKFCITF